MRNVLLLALFVLLPACTGSYLRVACGEASALGSFFGGEGESRSISHSDPEYEFTEQDKQLLNEACPMDAEGQLLRVLLDERDAS